jgi:hypothetical protein
MQRDYSVDAPDIALTAGTALYMLGLITGSGNPIDVISVKIGADAVATAGSLKVEALTWTSDGTGTAYTPKPYNGDGQLVACSTTAKIDYTVAPTGTITVIETWEEYVPTGPFQLLLPLGREYTVPVSTKYGLRLTSTTASFNGYAGLVFEE